MIDDDDDDDGVWNSRWNENCQGKQKYSEKSRPSAILSTTNPTLPDPGPNPGRVGGKAATDFLKYGTALLSYNTLILGFLPRKNNTE
jgi:hypothetical protein